MTHKCQTYGEQFNSAMKCETTQEAEAWMEREVSHYVNQHNMSPEKAFEIIRDNLGYMAGYYNDAVAKKVDALFGAKHPGYEAFKVR